MFLDCPAYLDEKGARRCGLPAEVEDQYTMRSTDGPVEMLRIRCPSGHWFNVPAESLVLPVPAALPRPAEAATAFPSSVARQATGSRPAQL